MGAYSGVGAFLSKSSLRTGAYSGVGANSIIYGKCILTERFTPIGGIEI